MKQSDIENGLRKTASFLYDLDADVSDNLYRELSFIRQMLNEVYKNRQIGNNELWDLLQPLIKSTQSELITSIEAGLEKRQLVEPVTKREVTDGDIAGIDLDADPKGSLKFIQDNGYNQALLEVKALLNKKRKEL